MAASQAMEHWMNDDHLGANPADPAILRIPMRPSAASAGVSATDRFDAEAMPHLNDIFRTATRLLSDRARAEDVAQEVYLQAWKSFHRFETGTNCRAWLFKILFHCVNHHRRKWFRFPLLKETEEFLEANLAAPAVVPEALTDSEIVAALDRVPSDFRSAGFVGGVGGVFFKESAGILLNPSW